MSKFDKIAIGATAQINHVITNRDIETFVELTGDDNRLHVDNKYAAKTSFKKPVVHGMLGASFISTIIGTKLPGDGALWFSQQLDFLKPVRVGDTITVKAEVLRKFGIDRTVEMQTDIFNQHKQKVTTGIARVKIIEEELSVVKEETTAPKKIAVVLGATGGIGWAVCHALAEQGYDIGIHCHKNRELAHKLSRELQRKGCQVVIAYADITEEDQVLALFDKINRFFESVTLVVNCTTVKVANIQFSSIDWEDMQSHIDVNVKGAFYIAKYFVPFMEKKHYGKLINIITQAVETPSPEWLHYITAKAALSGFCKALAVELAPKGIRVNMISPGMTETELISDIPEKIRLVNAAKTPLRRLASPDDIAHAVCYLASPGADFITGETIRVNGGQVMI